MKIKYTILLSFLCYFAHGQELFNMAENASNTPKGIWGLKMMSESYDERTALKNQVSARIIYGLTSKITVWAQPMVSNHHLKDLPNTFGNHTHQGPLVITTSNQKVYGRKYPYRFSGLHLYWKHRVITIDKDNEHFRTAYYLEANTLSNNAHDEAEPHLQGDNEGVGFGMINTYLKGRFSVSLTAGYIIPKTFTENEGQDTTGFTVNYANAYTGSVSFGYLLYPKKYESYQQTNYNIYLEFIGKKYDTPRVSTHNFPVTIVSEHLIGNHYVDVHLGFQQIIQSNDRLELTIGTNLIRRSYRHLYPVVNISWQHYFYKK